MIGRGCVASTYGWAFETSGHTVDYLLRPRTFQGANPMLEYTILDCRKKMLGQLASGRMHTTLRDHIPTQHDYDLIFISISHRSIVKTLEEIAPMVGNATVGVFSIMWTDDPSARPLFPPSRSYSVFRSLEVVFPNGRLRGILQSWVYFDANSKKHFRGRAARSLFTTSGFTITEKSDFGGWLAIHFIMNGGVLSSGLVAGSLYNMFSSFTHRRAAFETMRELLPLLHAHALLADISATCYLCEYPRSSSVCCWVWRGASFGHFDFSPSRSQTKTRLGRCVKTSSTLPRNLEW